MVQCYDTKGLKLMAMLSRAKVSLIFRKAESHFLETLSTMYHNNALCNFRPKDLSVNSYSILYSFQSFYYLIAYSNLMLSVLRSSTH